MLCPYYDEKYKTCAFYGNYQDESSRNYYCLSENWRRCANYTNRSLEEKVEKRIRTNPDL
jgi:hypothetical protein